MLIDQVEGYGREHQFQFWGRFHHRLGPRAGRFRVTHPLELPPAAQGTQAAMREIQKELSIKEIVITTGPARRLDLVGDPQIEFDPTFWQAKRSPVSAIGARLI